MGKNRYETPIVWFVLLENEDIIMSMDVGVDGNQQEGWWEHD